MDNPKIYVMGQTIGKWFELPYETSRIYAELNLSEENGFEYEILDSEGFYDHTVKADSDLDELNAYAERLLELSKIDHFEEFKQHMSIEEMLENKDTLEFVEADNDGHLAEIMIGKMGGIQELSPVDLEKYFNFDAYGRDLAESDFYRSEHGYIRK